MRPVKRNGRPWRQLLSTPVRDVSVRRRAIDLAGVRMPNRTTPDHHVVADGFHVNVRVLRFRRQTPGSPRFWTGRRTAPQNRPRRVLRGRGPECPKRILPIPAGGCVTCRIPTLEPVVEPSVGMRRKPRRRADRYGRAAAVVFSFTSVRRPFSTTSRENGGVRASVKRYLYIDFASRPAKRLRRPVPRTTR